MFLQNCSYKKSVFYVCQLALLNIFFISQKRTVFNAIRFLLGSLIANMETILRNFQQKFALVSFQHFAIKLLTKKCLVRLKSASKSSLSWRGKCDVFLLQLYITIDPKNLSSENDVMQLAELQIHVQK